MKRIHPFLSLLLLALLAAICQAAENARPTQQSKLSAPAKAELQAAAQYQS
jgi:hypothetical protein